MTSQGPQVRVLAVSDQIDPRIHTGSLRSRMPDVEMVLGCGDIPARYLEFLADALEKPVYFVHGNHLEERTRVGPLGEAHTPMGCVDLGGRTTIDDRTQLILSGIPGCRKYSGESEYQYSEYEVLWMVFKMTPRLIYNRLRHGRYLDVLVTHSPPLGINDRADPAHKGLNTINRFIKWFHPALHVHGHIHLYDRNKPCETSLGDTRIVNVYPYKVLDTIDHCEEDS